jgi:hypothetical protein
MLNPWRLNKFSTRSDAIHLCTDREVAKFLPEEPHGKSNPPPKIAAIYPAHSFRRIAAQNGQSTIHGSSKSLESYVPAKTPPILARIVIPGKKKVRRAIHRNLRHLGVTHATIFPDLGGLATAIKHEWVDYN